MQLFHRFSTGGFGGLVYVLKSWHSDVSDGCDGCDGCDVCDVCDGCDQGED